MAKGSKIKVPPKKLDLRNYVDLDLEAEKFELAPVRVQEIAKEVSREAPPTLNFSVTHRESELKDRLEAIYTEAVRKLEECHKPGCGHRFTDIHDFLVHHRIHLISGPDDKVAAAVIRDIERTLVPTVEKTVDLDGALPLAERQKLIGALREHRMLPAGFDSPGDSPQTKH